MTEAIDRDAATWMGKAFSIAPRVEPIVYTRHRSYPRNDAILLACYHFDDAGDCQRFRFAHFPDFENIRRWSWLSQPFGLDSSLDQLSPQQKHKAPKKWLRTRLRNKKEYFFDSTGIGILSLFAAMGLSSIATAAELWKDQTANTVGAANLGAWLAVFVFGPAIYGWFTPSTRVAHRLTTGRKLQDLNEQKENFLLRKHSIANKPFYRLMSFAQNSSSFRAVGVVEKRRKAGKWRWWKDPSINDLAK